MNRNSPDFLTLDELEELPPLTRFFLRHGMAIILALFLLILLIGGYTAYDLWIRPVMAGEENVLTNPPAQPDEAATDGSSTTEQPPAVPTLEISITPIPTGE